jgi:RNA polymerase sigma factor (sigma-70 family)
VEVETMARSPFGSVLRYLHRAAGRPQLDEWTDTQLLERFITGHEDAALEALIQRHGPVVWGVCQRLLGDGHDAEDAFQATFLVLVRKPGSVKKHASLGSWLYGVAYRVALRARADAARRRHHERQVATMAAPQSALDDGWQELRPVLDAELNRLPEKYRAPLILCYLQSKTNEQAARELGWPAGSISKRLAQGRDLLRERLAQRGVALSAVALGTALANNAATAAAPTSVMDLTVTVAHVLVTTQATTAAAASAPVAALTEGVVKAMALDKLKFSGLVLCALLALTGSGFLVHQALADKPSAEQPAAPQTANAKTEVAVTSLSPATYGKVLEMIKPQPGESKWAEIPWLSNVADARQKAVAEDKPILVWSAGGGEPLGRA